MNGTLYGTTHEGGTGGVGAVFSISTAGKEHVLYSFRNTPDGAYPVYGLTYANGVFYGTTAEGGVASNSGGTIFSIDTTGKKERVLHSFGGASDGYTPEGTLLYLNGTLYGTTIYGGTFASGTVFKLTP